MDEFDIFETIIMFSVSNCRNDKTCTFSGQSL